MRRAVGPIPGLRFGEVGGGSDPPGRGRTGPFFSISVYLYYTTVWEGKQLYFKIYLFYFFLNFFHFDLTNTQSYVII